MFDSVRVVRFKRFHDQTFDVSGGTVLLAGPNNSGKTTLLHAISAWNLALTRWKAERGHELESGGKKTTRKPAWKKRIGILLDEFTALPLREMNLLWLNRHTAARPEGSKQPKPAPIYVQVTRRGAGGRLPNQSLTMEFYYANEKLVYVRPVKSPELPEPVENFPAFVDEISVVHVPAFSGIGTQEPNHSPGMRNKLVGEGRPGEIVRNLLHDIHERSRNNPTDTGWKELTDDIERLFQCRLLPPMSSPANPYILAEYQPKGRSPESSARSPRLDIASAGSGFHQVLLLLSFFYSREAAVLLLDEPDAHLHFILQREVFDHLRELARRRRSQLVISTHAEVLLEDTDPEQIISFVGDSPRRLALASDKRRLQDALKTLTSLDLVQADHVGAVLYVEDESDHRILREWAERLNHPAWRFLKYAYVFPLRGKGNLGQAKRHFQSLTLAKPQIRGVCVLDSDNDSPERPDFPTGLATEIWKRYEIENYLLHPAAVKRFVRGGDGGLPFDDRVVDEQFAANFPPNTDWLGDSRPLRELKGGDLLVEILSRSGQALPKRDLWMLAAQFRADEIHADVVAVLDRIAEIVPGVVPSIVVNQTPDDPEGATADTVDDESDNAETSDSEF